MSAPNDTLALKFDNRLVLELPADPIQAGPPRQVQQAYSKVQPTPVAAPKLLGVSTDFAARLGLSIDDLNSAEFLAAFSGNTLLPGMQPHAVNYGGHQFAIEKGKLPLVRKYSWVDPDQVARANQAQAIS